MEAIPKLKISRKSSKLNFKLFLFSNLVIVIGNGNGISTNPI